MSNKILYYSSVVIFVFLLDRVSKIYILNLAETEQTVDIYLSSYLNLYLIWNTGVGFGILSSNQVFFYNSITFIIILINIFILFMVFKYDGYRVFFLLMILGGSLGNLYDRIYYKAVPDFIDLHYESFHWFVFNVADIFISLGVLCLILAEVIINKGSGNEKK
tara:strand:- start:220 stop:708 length:489 start_codon:yes stop_codon:yes gene_type:complete